MHLLFNKGNYRKNLVLYLLIASFPGIIFSFLLLVVSKDQIENELQTIHQNHMINSIDSIQSQLANLELVLANMAFNANKEDYSNLDRADDYQKTRDIYNLISMMKGYNPFIGRVELFLDSPEPLVYTETGFKILEDAEQIDHYQSLLGSSKKMFWNHSIASVEGGNKDRFAPLVMVHNLDNFSIDAFGSLIVFLDKQRLNQILQSPYEQGSTFILRDKQQWLFAEEAQIEPTRLQKAVMNEISERGATKPFVFHFEKIKYTVTYSQFSRLGETWYYVSVAPMTNITEPVIFISKLFIYANLLVLTIAIVISLFASRLLYAPVKRLTSRISGDDPVSYNEFSRIEMHLNQLSSKSEDLQNSLREQLPHLRAGFILQLVQGYLYAYREEYLQVRMQQFGSLAANKKYVIAFIRISGFKKLMDRFMGDEGLVTFLAVNIAEEVLRSSDIETDVLNFHDLSMGILFAFSADKPVQEIDIEVRGYCEQIIGNINGICRMNVSVGISRPADSLKSIHSIFEEIKVSLSFRNLQEDNQIIEMKKMDVHLNSQDQFEYPFDLEKAIIQSIRQRDQEEAIRLVHEFFTTPTHQNVSEVMIRQGAFKLLSGIFHIVLQSELIEDFINGSANLYEKLYKLKDPSEISHWFEKKLIIPIIEELSKKQDQRLRFNVQKVMSLIETNYMDDISLEACANEVNLNPSFLSKIFKDFSSWNFIDYLTHIRLTKAKELLIETDSRIKDVAESVGYNQHSYFNRIFKKEEGITPSEFRAMSRTMKT